LKSQLAKATPSYTSMEAYQVTNTAAAACPPTGTAWRASEKLPPVVNPDLCECMVKSLSCVASTSLSGEDIGELFGIVCGLDDKACAGTAVNPSTGVYGAYSMCTGSQQLSFVVDQYYKNQNNAADACDFGGKAKTQTPASAEGNCETLVEAAGSAGTGTVTAGPSGTGSSSSSSGSSSGNAAAGTVVPQFNAGLLHISLYVLVAGITGAGMIML
jgi:1,3-beta-glucanosyltransferase GAS1